MLVVVVVVVWKQQQHRRGGTQVCATIDIAEKNIQDGVLKRTRVGEKIVQALWIQDRHFRKPSLSQGPHEYGQRVLQVIIFIVIIIIIQFKLIDVPPAAGAVIIIIIIAVVVEVVARIQDSIFETTKKDVDYVLLLLLREYGKGSQLHQEMWVVHLLSRTARTLCLRYRIWGECDTKLALKWTPLYRKWMSSERSRRSK